MAIVITKKAENWTASLGTTVQSGTISIASGTHLVACVGDLGEEAISSVVWNGQSLTKRAEALDTNDSRASIWDLYVESGASANVTVTYAASTADRYVAALQISDVSSYDVSGSNTGNTSSPSVSTSSATNYADEAMIAIVTQPGKGINTFTNDLTTSEYITDSTSCGFGVCSGIASSTGTKTAACSSNQGKMSFVVATFYGTPDLQADATTATTTTGSAAATVTPGGVSVSAALATVAATAIAATATIALSVDAAAATAETTTAPATVTLGHPPTKSQFAFVNDSVARLPAGLTINSVTEYPLLRFIGPGANASTWECHGYGEALDIAGSGTAPALNDGSPLHGLPEYDDSVSVQGGKHYQADDTDFGSIGTNDFVFELVCRLESPASNKTLAGKESGVGNLNPGWQFVVLNGPCMALLINDGQGDGTGRKWVPPNPAAITAGAFNHWMWFVNKSEASTYATRVYRNGKAYGSGVDVSDTGSLNVAVAMKMFSGTYGVLSDSGIAYFALYSRASWHQEGSSGPAEWDGIAAERFLTMLDAWPQLAQGTEAPVSYGRSSSATVYKIESGSPVSYTVDKDWLAITEKADGSGNIIRGWSPKSGETLRIKGDDGNIGGVGSDKQLCVQAKIWLPNEDTASDLYLCSLNDGGSSSDEVKVYVESSNDQVRAESAASGGNAGDATRATDVSNDSVHDVLVRWKPNYLCVTVDGVAGTPDTDCGIPDDIDRLDLGSDLSGANQFGTTGGIISQLQFWQDLEANAGAATATATALAATVEADLVADAVTATATTGSASPTVTTGNVNVDAAAATTTATAAAPAVTPGGVSCSAGLATTTATGAAATVTPGNADADATTATATTGSAAATVTAGNVDVDAGLATTTATSAAATVTAGNVDVDATSATTTATGLAATVSTGASADAQCATATAGSAAATITAGNVDVDAATATTTTGSIAATVTPGNADADAATAATVATAQAATVTPGNADADAATATATAGSVAATVAPGNADADATTATATATSAAPTVTPGAVSCSAALATTTATAPNATASIGAGSPQQADAQLATTTATSAAATVTAGGVSVGAGLATATATSAAAAVAPGAVSCSAQLATTTATAPAATVSATCEVAAQLATTTAGSFAATVTVGNTNADAATATATATAVAPTVTTGGVSVNAALATATATAPAATASLGADNYVNAQLATARATALAATVTLWGIRPPVRLASPVQAEVRLQSHTQSEVRLASQVQASVRLVSSWR